MNITLGMVLDYARQENIPERTAKRFFFHFDARGWIDAQKVPILNWQSKLNGWWLEDQTKGARSQNQTPNQSSQAPQRKQTSSMPNAQIERLKERYNTGDRFYAHEIELMISYGIATAQDFDAEGYKI